MKIRFNEKLRKNLEKINFRTNATGIKYVDKNSKFELPCSILDADLEKHLEVGAFSYIEKGFKNYEAVKIGRFCSIAENCKINVGAHPLNKISTSPYFYAKNFMGSKINHLHKSFKKDFRSHELVTIEDDVWIGSDVTIMRGVKIGRGAVIGAKALVTKDVEEFSVVVGIPAKHLKYREVQENFDTFKIWQDNGGRLITGNDFVKYYSTRKKISRKIKSFMRKFTKREK